MKFLITLSEFFYPVEKSEEVENLKKLGFNFEVIKFGKKEYLTYTNDGSIEINSLEELLNFQKKFGDIIISANNQIEIYNGDRE